MRRSREPREIGARRSNTPMPAIAPPQVAAIPGPNPPNQLLTSGGSANTSKGDATARVPSHVRSMVAARTDKTASP